MKKLKFLVLILITFLISSFTMACNDISDTSVQQTTGEENKTEQQIIDNSPPNISRLIENVNWSKYENCERIGNYTFTLSSKEMLYRFLKLSEHSDQKYFVNYWSDIEPHTYLNLEDALNAAALIYDLPIPIPKDYFPDIDFTKGPDIALTFYFYSKMIDINYVYNGEKFFFTYFINDFEKRENENPIVIDDAKIGNHSLNIHKGYRNNGEEYLTGNFYTQFGRVNIFMTEYDDLSCVSFDKFEIKSLREAMSKR